jgi:hypothetical protein
MLYPQAPPAAVGRRALRQVAGVDKFYVAVTIRLPSAVACDVAYARLLDAAALNTAIVGAIGTPAVMSVPPVRTVRVTVALTPSGQDSVEEAQADAAAAAAALSAAVASGAFAPALRGALGAGAAAFTVELAEPATTAVATQVVPPATPAPKALLSDGPIAGVVVSVVVGAALLLVGLLMACRDKRAPRPAHVKRARSVVAKPADAAPMSPDDASPPRSQREPWERTPLPEARPGGTRAQLLHTHAESPELQQTLAESSPDLPGLSAHPLGSPVRSPPLAPLLLPVEDAPEAVEAAAGVTTPRASAPATTTPPSSPQRAEVTSAMTPGKVPLGTPPRGKRVSLLTAAATNVDAPPGWITPPPASPLARASGGSDAGSERSDRPRRESFFGRLGNALARPSGGSLARMSGGSAGEGAPPEEPAFPPNPLFAGGGGETPLGDGGSDSDDEPLPTRMSASQVESISGGARSPSVPLQRQHSGSGSDGGERLFEAGSARGGANEE